MQSRDFDWALIPNEEDLEIQKNRRQKAEILLEEYNLRDVRDVNSYEIDFCESIEIKLKDSNYELSEKQEGVIDNILERWEIN